MRIVFMGTAALACRPLCALAESGRHEVACVITQPDRPCGRRLRTAPSPIKQTAQAAGLRVETPVRINTPESIELLRALRPRMIVVVAYGQILRQAVLDIPPLGCLNIHASLLPKYRGAAPVQWAIANGEPVTGVTAMMMNARLDAGDVVDQRSVPIDPDDTAGTLHDRLSSEGARLLLDVLDAFEAGCAGATPQREAEATYAPKLTKADGAIDWREPAEAIVNRVRAFNPWPCCWCDVPRPTDQAPDRSETVRVLWARAETGSGIPGTVLDVSDGGPLIAARVGSVRLIEVQPAGKRPMSGHDYLRGHPLAVGERLKAKETLV